MNECKPPPPPQTASASCGRAPPHLRRRSWARAAPPSRSRRRSPAPAPALTPVRAQSQPGLLPSKCGPRRPRARSLGAPTSIPLPRSPGSPAPPLPANPAPPLPAHRPCPRSLPFAPSHNSQDYCQQRCCPPNDRGPAPLGAPTSIHDAGREKRRVWSLTSQPSR